MGLNFGNFFSLFKNATEGIGERQRKRGFLSIHPSSMTTNNPDTDQRTYSAGGLRADQNSLVVTIPVELPEGATILSCIVYGNAAASAENWNLGRTRLNSFSVSGMAGAAINTKSGAIPSKSIVENEKYIYKISTGSIDINDTIYSAMIEYIV